MRFRLLRLLVLAVLALAAAQAPASAQPADHVVLISIDGLRPEFYLEPGRPAPMLRHMAAQGVSAEGVRAAFPSSTYPSHTTIITGAWPARHGIYFNRDPESGAWTFFHDSIRVETLWAAVARTGGGVANVGWPVSVGAPADFNVVISGALQSSGLSADPVRDLTAPAGLFAELEREATGRLDVNRDLSNRNAGKEARVAQMAAYLVAQHRPRLLTVALQATDAHQHAFGREHLEVDLALAAADHAIARIVQAYREAGILERTAFVISGDHGFSDLHTRLNPNRWLADAGLAGHAGRPRFVSSGGSAYLFVSGPQAAAAEAAVREVLAAQPAPVRALFRVVERDELDALGAHPAPPLALGAAAGVVFGEAADAEPVTAASGGAHGHDADVPGMKTGFVAWGAGIRPGLRVATMDLTDVAPLVAALLGLDFAAPDGLLRPGLLAD